MQASAAHQVVPRCRVATKCLPCGARGEARHSAGLRFWLAPLAEEFTVPDCPQGRRSTRRFAKHHDEVSDVAQGSVGDNSPFCVSGMNQPAIVCRPRAVALAMVAILPIFEIAAGGKKTWGAANA